MGKTKHTQTTATMQISCMTN